MSTYRGGDYSVFSLSAASGNRLCDIPRNGRIIYYTRDHSPKNSEKFLGWVDDILKPRIQAIEEDNSGIYIFSDGGVKKDHMTNNKIKVRSGVGAICMYFDQELGRHKQTSAYIECGQTTLYDAELIGILLGIKKMIKITKTYHKNLYICTDNLNTLESAIKVGQGSSHMVRL